MTAPPAGLVHLGLLHRGPDDLAASAVPELRRALADGEDVVVAADRATVRRVREALGADAERVEFPPPSALAGPSAPGFVAAVRGWAPPGRRTTLLGQYAPAVPGADRAYGEDALGLVLDDLPLTLICCCRHDEDPEQLAVARRSHPRLATAVGTVDNPDYRPPSPTSPVPAAVWGTVTVRVSVDGTADLAEVRRRVADAAAGAGLEGDAVRAAVLAVHEAVVLGVRDGDPDHAGLTVEIRSDTGPTVFCEITGPRGATTAMVSPGDPLAHVRPFCARAALHDDPDRRAVRVLSTA
ncbi:hypothetical protein Acsp06_35220 [Actinomycetospora sp. NBRC 106375]|uniref:hypothetical protein n=1 Tax=Actinomycetospora sp. NBRC 106375 TaxID=3032207 RepID=UPI0024A4B795|nr:hypothetical protein [Actinomycetospora sp. NBRC 106375]GLZ47337.1 hypothetical protein Acsp06_35220 [Actinomycetospora sp. NBRC 106375]